MHMAFQEKIIGFPGEKDARQMIREIGAWKEIVRSGEVLNMVYQACGGHPMRTRFPASEACAEGAKEQANLQKLQRVYDKICDDLRRHRIGVYFEDPVWAMLLDDVHDSRHLAVSEPDGPLPAAWEDAP